MISFFKALADRDRKPGREAPPSIELDGLERLEVLSLQAHSLRQSHERAGDLLATQLNELNASPEIRKLAATLESGEAYPVFTDGRSFIKRSGALMRLPDPKETVKVGEEWLGLGVSARGLVALREIRGFDSDIYKNHKVMARVYGTNFFEVKDDSSYQAKFGDLARGLAASGVTLESITHGLQLVVEDKTRELQSRLG